jgi:hypothetical protein
LKYYIRRGAADECSSSCCCCWKEVILYDTVLELPNATSRNSIIDDPKKDEDEAQQKLTRCFLTRS